MGDKQASIADEVTGPVLKLVEGMGDARSELGDAARHTMMVQDLLAELAPELFNRNAPAVPLHGTPP